MQERRGIMSKVYIVTEGEYSYYHIEKVFSTREKAELYIAAHQTSGYSNDYQIEEFDIDEDILEGKVYYGLRVYIRYNNDTVYYDKCEDTIDYFKSPTSLSIIKHNIIQIDNIQVSHNITLSIPLTEKPRNVKNTDYEDVLKKVANDYIVSHNEEIIDLIKHSTINKNIISYESNFVSTSLIKTVAVNDNEES